MCIPKDKNRAVPFNFDIGPSSRRDLHGFARLPRDTQPYRGSVDAIDNLRYIPHAVIHYRRRCIAVHFPAAIPMSDILERRSRSDGDLLAFAHSYGAIDLN